MQTSGCNFVLIPSVCPRSVGPSHIVSYYIKQVEISWTCSIHLHSSYIPTNSPRKILSVPEVSASFETNAVKQICDYICAQKNILFILPLSVKDVTVCTLFRYLSFLGTFSLRKKSFVSNYSSVPKSMCPVSNKDPVFTLKKRPVTDSMCSTDLAKTESGSDL